MRTMNFPLRLMRSLLEEARKTAESEDVSLNQLINVAVAEKVSALRTEKQFHERMRHEGSAEIPRIPDRAGKVNPRMKGDELLIGGQQVQPPPVPDWTPDLKRAGESAKAFGRATPQLGQLKRRLDKMRGS